MSNPCECGCGQPTPIAKRTRPYLGHVKGQPTRFLRGHNAVPRLGLDRWEPHDMGYETPCWIWTGAISADHGYGHTRIGRPRRQVGAHRALYEAHIGPIPEGMQLDHLCRVRLCVNPAHMEPVTRSENVQRGGAATLAAEDVREIRTSTDRLLVLAQRYGITVNAVWRVRARRTWKDLA